MRRLVLTVASMILATSVLGCPLLKKKQQPDADADDDTPAAVDVDASTVSVAGTGAKNEASVLRYANETPLANEPAVIGKDGTVVRNFPGNGPAVATLAKGTPVAKVAAYFSTATLVMFDDPSGDGSKLLGWVSPKAFDVAAPPPTRTVVVPPRIVDASAPGPVVVRDAGGPSPVVVVDAGGGSNKSVAPVDAGGGGGGGGGIPQPPKGSLAVPPTDGKCPDNWALTEGMCRRKCSADTECPRGTKCVTKKGTKVCSSDG